MRALERWFRLGLLSCLILGLTAALYLALASNPLTHAIGSGPISHSLAFFIVPVISALLWPRLNLAVHIAAYVLLGGIIELLQGIFTTSRRMEFDDWMIDIAVAAVTLSLFYLIRELVEKRREHPPIE